MDAAAMFFPSLLKGSATWNQKVVSLLLDTGTVPHPDGGYLNPCPMEYIKICTPTSDCQPFRFSDPELAINYQTEWQTVFILIRWLLQI